MDVRKKAKVAATLVDEVQKKWEDTGDISTEAGSTPIPGSLASLINRNSGYVIGLLWTENLRQ
jgi:hypothetical protein